jgi:hypothetical protein
MGLLNLNTFIRCKVTPEVASLKGGCVVEFKTLEFTDDRGIRARPIGLQELLP